ncbi:uncharacterized protein LOC110885661 isoform X1 [Helianthus annuus]|uniref:uncharacterized protein LOC110885661 isoform X1 n=1 Tax=Helianthus annuus TaxID=4232 RepID=UPI001652B7C7|nr:uncharacterized protein LOC110885661 isoform X1 [Helianthus annuus]
MPTLGGIIFPFHYTWSKAVFGSTYIFENFKVSGGTIPRTTAAHHRESPPMSFTTTTRSSSRSSTSPFRSRKSSDPPPDTTRRTTKPQATKPSQPPPLSSSSSSSHKVKENVTVTARLRPLKYNVPRSFLKLTANLLVLFEEEYANPLNISLDTVSIDKVCGRVSDSHPPRVNSREVSGHYQWRPTPRVRLRCPKKQIISKIVFASHGNPSGDCENYSIGKCHSSNSQQVVEKAYLGRR